MDWAFQPRLSQVSQCRPTAVPIVAACVKGISSAPSAPAIPKSVLPKKTIPSSIGYEMIVNTETVVNDLLAYNLSNMSYTDINSRSFRSLKRSFSRELAKRAEEIATNTTSQF